VEFLLPISENWMHFNKVNIFYLLKSEKSNLILYEVLVKPSSIESKNYTWEYLG